MLLPLDTVLQALKKADLVGTPYIPASFRPSIFLQVEFPSGVSVELGNDVEASSGVDEPTISFTAEVRPPPAPLDVPTPTPGDAQDPTTSGSTYALVSFDPDAPSRADQSKGPWRHLIRGGFKPKSLDEIAVTGGGSLVDRTDEELVTPWVGPSPGAGTGYVLPQSRLRSAGGDASLFLWEIELMCDIAQ